jgi:hypothetical protein
MVDKVIRRDYLSPLEVVYKEHDNTALEPEPEPHVYKVHELDPQVAAVYNATAEAFELDRLDQLKFISAERKRERRELEKALVPLRQQIAALEKQVTELNGMITVMLKVFQPKDTKQILRP